MTQARRTSTAVSFFSLMACLACGGEAQHGPGTDSAPPKRAGGTAAGPQPSAAGRASVGGAHVAEGGGAVGSDGGATATNGEEMAGAGAGGIDSGGADSGGDDTGGAGQPPGGGCNPIVFGDIELELTVRALLNGPAGPLTSSDVVGLTTLTTPAITSLAGVECLTDLTSLDFGSLPPSRVTDLSPLAGLTKLEELSLARNPVASLEPIGELPSLRTLYMFKMPVVLDLSPLGTAPQLELIDMTGDTVADLTPLSHVTTLRQLSLRDGVLANPNSVSTLSNVQDLDLTAVLSDATPLVGLNKAQKLRVGGKRLAHFSAIVGLVKLQYLDVSQAGLTDISALGGLTQLRGLNLASNHISSVTPLSDLLELGSVVLSGNQITDLGPLAGNAGIGAGDTVYLEQNPLLCATVAGDVQAMRGRGATVTSDCP